MLFINILANNNRLRLCLYFTPLAMAPKKKIMTPCFKLSGIVSTASKHTPSPINSLFCLAYPSNKGQQPCYLVFIRYIFFTFVATNIKQTY